jgi:fibro-slime domain-containing protein
VVKTLFDGNPTYFPVDGKGFSTPSVNAQCHIPPAYLINDTSWPLEPGGAYHNFSFTSEVRYWFLYDSSKTYQLDFMGDDDVWVFVNKTLAVDLGGIHIPVGGSFSLPTDAAKFGLTSGNVYEIALFHAERQTTGSTFKLTLSGFNTSPSVCGPICGNGILQPGEQCDNGSANCNPQTSDCYNKCTTSCLVGGYCGDSATNGAEECDNGSNTDTYWKAGACGPGCKLPPRCGDGIVQPENGEECDAGANNTGAYGGCNADCTLGPYCGDAFVSSTERCDDGLNDGTYGTCGDPNQALPNCNFGPRCGDGVLQGDWGEECDAGSANCNPRTTTCASDACLISCRKAGGCGDGIPQAGEQCDYGSVCPITCNDPATCPTDCNNGAYGGCSPGCVLAPRCGDGIKNGPEACDDGVNDNSYGTCAPNCKLAPYCGDGIKNGPEECDHGVAGNGTDGLCTTGCKAIVYVPT